MKNRKRPTHSPNVSKDNRAVIIFVTVCASVRIVNTFATPEMHELLIHSWNNAQSYLVGGYVLMPDHIHLFCAPAVLEAENVAKWVRYWKSMVSREIRRRSGGILPKDAAGGASVTLPEDDMTVVPPCKKSIFQRDCWDTQLRRGENYHEKWLYVRNNPVRAGLVQNAEAWPYSGVINDLIW